MLVVIYPDLDIWNYVLKDVKQIDENIRFIPLNQYCSKVQRAIRQSFPNSQLLPFMLFGRELRKLLKSLNEFDSVLLCDYTGVNILRTIRKIINPKVKVSLWYWNPISGDLSREYQISAAKDIGFDVYTFNPIDASTYQIHLLNQFFPMTSNIDDSVIINDFYFQGYEKGRFQILQELSSKLQKYRTEICIVNDVHESIPYTEYIDNIQHTRCLIDIVQKGQTGLTLRPLEALAFNKKLITNNADIINYGFYRKENIFILGKDDLTKIDEFINVPIANVDNHTKYEFDTGFWLKQFIYND